jgi:hypothetical protein
VFPSFLNLANVGIFPIVEFDQELRCHSIFLDKIFTDTLTSLL